ncbi:MAG: zincin-like metallopeptidase domain-containing protein [Casimicrobiaceae bacterium]
MGTLRKGARQFAQYPPRVRVGAAFGTAAGYYNVALHELTHWTGHAGRCNRNLTGRFRDGAYTAEELIAEMGSAYLCAHCRLDGELRCEPSPRIEQFWP